ncbi:hypothetical protein ACERII_16960 [Evansella sp. AB-rgal1]|uniref:hypothetical protein n=1 Tax=Evansella sp. AB-rgal1 TaxID=3242696 RepID=UPI00359DDA99
MANNDFNSLLQSLIELNVSRIKQQQQRQEQQQTQSLTDLDNISNVGNPVVNVNLSSILDKKDRKGKPGNGKVEPKILSTGVLNTAVDQTAAHMEVVNLSSDTKTLRFQIIDWNNTAVPTVLSDQTVTVPPNTLRIFTTNVAPFHYELRVDHPGDPDLIINHFAINAGTFTIPGLTFLQDDLKEITSPLI